MLLRRELLRVARHHMLIVDLPWIEYLVPNRGKQKSLMLKMYVFAKRLFIFYIKSCMGNFCFLRLEAKRLIHGKPTIKILRSQ